MATRVDRRAGHRARRVAATPTRGRSSSTSTRSCCCCATSTTSGSAHCAARRWAPPIDAFAGLVGDGDSGRLRADLVFAMLAGVFQLRGLLPDEPLATADPDVLAREIIGVVEHLTG